MRSVEILGCRLDMFDAQAAAEAILHYAREKRGAQIVTLGTEMVVYAQRDARYRAVVNGCALSLCDTVGLLAVARGRGAVLRDRVTGVELLERLCKGAAEEGLSVYLLGGAPGVAEEAAAVLRRRYPGLRVAGTHDGYFSPAESSQVAQTIRATGAQMLFAAMGF
ncbi:MAG TPA: WecB/TagA/CpsF family glycosyltransferase, partial [Candidatus Baltobacteraceae bacterium]|nr:WecB/TagA/CpsF family glycosyltransferase [Candidatus Baltobacteraceae bacterium]